MAKRPRFSRWRRLPPVFRTGENRPIGTGNELDRIILYLPSRLLDLAEVLAEKAGIPAIQEYCERLLIQAIEAEQVRQKVSGFEARRGPLEGLKEIAEDPDYLAEWQPRSEARPAMPSVPAVDALTVDFALADGDDADMPTDPDEGGVWFLDPSDDDPAVSPGEAENPDAPPPDPSRHLGRRDRPYGCLPTGPRSRSSGGTSATTATSWGSSHACDAGSPCPGSNRPSCCTR